MTRMQEDSLVSRITKALEPKFDAIDRRFDRLESTVDTLAVKVVEMDARMDTFSTKEELRTEVARITDVLDAHTAILQRLDQERVVTNYRLDRLSAHVGLV